MIGKIRHNYITSGRITLVVLAQPKDNNNLQLQLILHLLLM